MKERSGGQVFQTAEQRRADQDTADRSQQEDPADG